MAVDTRISPSIILVNGKIITVDQNNSIQQALAIQDDKIIAVGTTTDILSLKGENTKVTDLESKPVLPGFIDTHSHPGVAATVLLQINCISPPTKSVKEILEKVRQAAAKTKPGDWIRAINYNQLKLEEKHHITKEELDEAAPENPVVIKRLTGHMYVLNALALEKAGITRDTLDPEGGRIDKDSQGRYHCT